MSATRVLVWPVVGAAAVPTPEIVQEIYRLALELARAALLPSADERAGHASSNELSSAAWAGSSGRIRRRLH
jgi:hypothetical protein